MNETELAERFNKELDRMLQSGREVPFAPDQGAMDLAAALSRTDYSDDSLIKKSLRERLAGQESSGGPVESLRALLRNICARPALAAACLLLALLPLTRRSTGPGPSQVSSARLTAALALPVSGAAAHKPVVPVPALRRVAGMDPGVFHSIPMPRLEGEPIENFPIESAGEGTPVILAAGREMRVENGSGVVWETENAVFIYERRGVSPDELFQLKSI